MGSSRDKSLFNETQKMEYIEFEGINKESLTNYFIRLKNSETRYNKDIVDMNQDEFKDAIISLGISREGSIGHVLSLLRGYASWAQLNRKTKNENIAEKLSPEGLLSKTAIASKMLKSPKQLEHILSTIEDGYDNLENKEVINRLVFWLIYYGMEIKQLQMLKKSDIDYDNKTVVTKEGLKYIVDDNVVELWKQCEKIDYIEKKGTRALSGQIHCNLVISEFLFRPIEGTGKTKKKSYLSEQKFFKIVRSIFQNYTEETNHEMFVTPYNIKKSGIFYRMYLLERNDKIEITPEIVAEHFKIETSNRNELLINTRALRNDYENWKLTFSYM